MKGPIEQFKQEVKERIDSYSSNTELQTLSTAWVEKSMRNKYVYNYTWMGIPIIQFPEDIVAMQEIIWSVKPDLIIETGIAHGGSILFSASMLELIGGDGEVLGIDIDIREHNKTEIEKHPMSKRVKMISGSSISEETIQQVHEIAKDKKNILVCLDSNHTHEHVMEELRLYAPLVTVGSFCVVFDTFVEDMPDDLFPDRPWSVGDNPKTAVKEFLKSNTNFEIDTSVHNKLLITVAPDGYLKRIK